MGHELNIVVKVDMRTVPSFLFEVQPDTQSKSRHTFVCYRYMHVLVCLVACKSNLHSVIKKYPFLKVELGGPDLESYCRYLLNRRLHKKFAWSTVVIYWAK